MINPFAEVDPKTIAEQMISVQNQMLAEGVLCTPLTLNLNDHPPNSDESDGTQPSCVHCTHWQYLDPCTTLWDFSEPDWHQGECNQPRIERRWPNPQAVIDAAQISFEHKLAVIAQQCPLYSPAPKTK
jgi:hypothetical protein